ncbi:MAG: elongation factor P hydroxylase [Gammaproteobacteria bacterium]|nr:MAG: elongation factor P hydroxylase [Gammaproteobacteria bacterium]
MSSGNSHTFDPQTRQLMDVFNRLFADSCNTRLIADGDEPIYLPADEQCDHHRLIFRHDYFSSALHEIAHWCIAGEQRRQLVDFGYWYNPDGRTEQQQRSFEQVEVKPQALEWLLSNAANHRFRISADNLAGGVGASEDFLSAVVQQARLWCETPMPPRAALLAEALAEAFGGESYLRADRYEMARL